MECLSPSHRVARGVKKEYTHSGSTTYGLGVMMEIRFLRSGMGDSFRVEYVSGAV